MFVRSKRFFFTTLTSSPLVAGRRSRSSKWPRPNPFRSSNPRSARRAGADPGLSRSLARHSAVKGQRLELPRILGAWNSPNPGRAGGRCAGPAASPIITEESWPARRGPLPNRPLGGTISGSTCPFKNQTRRSGGFLQIDKMAEQIFQTKSVFESPTSSLPQRATSLDSPPLRSPLAFSTFQQTPFSGKWPKPPSPTIRPHWAANYTRPTCGPSNRPFSTRFCPDPILWVIYDDLGRPQ